MNLIQFLKTSQNARKIFGKRELVIIEKQLFGINLTQSEKNRLSRDIRRKFEFITAAAKFKDEFSLKKSAEIKKIINDTKQIILHDKLSPSLQWIKLYGSTVDKTRTFRSDIDIAVKFREMTLKEATLFGIRVLGQTLENVDVQVYNVLPKKIQDEIDKKGVLIYGKD